jgi:AcrR family transcriptional regulator
VSTPSPARRGRPPRLTPDAILDAALVVLGEDGLEGFTMRALAKRLRADPMAVYRHFDGKDALLAALCDRVLADLAWPAEGATWREAVGSLAFGVRARMLEHRGLVPVLTAAPITQATAVAARRVLGALVEAGFDAEAAADGLGSVMAYVLGFVAFEHAAPATPDGVDAAAGDDALLRRTLAWGDGDRDFAAGLELVLDGLAGRLAAR